MSVASPVVSRRAELADPRPQGDPPDEAATSRPFLTRYCAQVVARPGRLIVASVATALAVVGFQHGRAAVSSAASSVLNGHSPVVGSGPGLTVDAPPHEVAAWSALAESAAATCPGLPPQVLVAIAHVESRLGRGTGPSPAGAQGPMQFLPATWAMWAADGDHDGRTDVTNPVDAVHGAARMLCANGGGEPARLRTAVWKYNNSFEYVDEVLRTAGFDPRLF